MIPVMIMAGGQGLRMRESRIETPKPLVALKGRALLERNLLQLMDQGFYDIHIAVPAALPQVCTWAEQRGKTLIEKQGARLRTWIERRALGNMGAAGQLAGITDSLLVLFADNLCALDLRELVRHHQAPAGAAMTLATHVYKQAVPYGVLEMEDGKVLGYREKPDLPVAVSSGIYVLGADALAELKPLRRLGASELVQALLAGKKEIRAFAHDAAWIDVNDAKQLARAELMLDAGFLPDWF